MAQRSSKNDFSEKVNVQDKEESTLRRNTYDNCCTKHQQQQQEIIDFFLCLDSMCFDTLSECREVPRSSEFRVSNIFGVFEKLDDVDHHVTRSEWPVQKFFFARASVSMPWDSNSMPRASVCIFFDAHQKPGISRVKVCFDVVHLLCKLKWERPMSDYPKQLEFLQKQNPKLFCINSYRDRFAASRFALSMGDGCRHHFRCCCRNQEIWCVQSDDRSND